MISDNVRRACGFCGGRAGFIRYDTAHGHADWCPHVNSRMAAVFVPLVESATTKPVDHDAVLRLHAQGISPISIASRVGCSQSSAHRIVAAHLASRRPAR